jgi:hypothetical protein
MAGDISNLTTNFSNVQTSGEILSGATISGSALSLTAGIAVTTITGTVISGSDLSSSNTVRGAIAVFSDVSSTNTVRAAKLKVGNPTGTNAGIPLTRVSAGTFAVAAIACVANASTSTAATIAGLTTDDILFVMPTSSMSSGVVVTGYSSGNSTATLLFSNASTAAQTIAAQTMAYAAVRFV